MEQSEQPEIKYIGRVRCPKCATEVIVHLYGPRNQRTTDDMRREVDERAEQTLKDECPRHSS